MHGKHLYNEITGVFVNNLVIHTCALFLLLCLSNFFFFFFIIPIKSSIPQASVLFVALIASC